MLLYVPHKLIQENRFQKRTDYGDIPGLAASIASMYDVYPNTRGLQQVPGARLIFRNGTTGPEGEVLTQERLTAMFKPGDTLPDGLPLFVELEFGHRRGRAFAHLIETDARYKDGLMPLDVRYLTDDQMLDGVWSENYQRQDLSAVEQAELIAAKLERAKANGGSQRVVAEEWKIDRSTVANKVRLLELPPSLKDANRRGELSERQLLALHPLMELDKKVRMAKTMRKVEMAWGSQVSPYGSPLSPTAYLQWINEAREKPTSEDIREYVKRINNAAGHALPETVAAFTAMLDDTIEQPECKGCSYRLNNLCLVKKCRDTKAKQYGEALARKVAEEHGLEFSDRPNDFAGLDDADLLAAFKSRSCEHLVIGWKEDGYYPARPFAKGGWTNAPFAADSREGIIVGHRGKLCGAIKVKGGQAVTARPGVEDAAAWEKSANKLIKKYRDNFIQALTTNMARNVQGEQLAILVQLTQPKGFENVKPGDYLELLVRHFYEKAGISYSYSPLKWFRKLGDFLDRVDIGRDALWAGLTMSEQWKDQATLALNEYADDFNILDRGDYYADTRTAIRATIAPLLRYYEASPDMVIDGTVVEMVGKLKDAAAYIQGIEQKEQAKAQGEGTLMQVLADDMALCDECSDPCTEEGDGVACSCGVARGAVLCEECYAEHGHMAHDTNPDNAWLNEVGNED